MKQDIEFAVPLFKAGAEWRINSVWHSITVIPDCHRFIVFLPKKSTIGSKNPIMGILEENRTFISSRPGCILCRLDENEETESFIRKKFDMPIPDESKEQ